MSDIDANNVDLKDVHKEISCITDVKQPCGYRAALITTLIFLPAAATLFTLVLFLLSSEQATPCKLISIPHWIPFGGTFPLWIPFWGTLGAFAAWLVLSPLFCKVADAKHAIPSSYGELIPRLKELEADLECFCPAMKSMKNPCKCIAYNEAVKEKDEIRKDLAMKGLTWVLATGYSKVWGELYRAEEAMIEVTPLKKVLQGAYYDEARLEGSDIPNHDDLLAQLRKAVVSINPSSHKYLKSTASVTAPPALTIGTTALPGATVAVGYSASLLATGGVPPYKWEVIGGAIPDNLAICTAGVLRGTPTIDGQGNFTIQVTDSTGVSAEKYFDLIISPQTQATPPPLAINTTTPLPWGTVDVEYKERLFATGGKPPYKWEVVEEVKPPDGLELSYAGLLHGIPNQAGEKTFKVQVTDSTSTGPIKPIDRKFTLLIKPSGETTAVPAGGTQCEQVARAVLRQVRNSLNEYRNARWNGLIVSRNRLLATFTLTTMIVFALLAIAIMSGANRPAIIAATVFYLVGATVGLCNRLRNDSQAESALPDYGLSATRLITIPLLSGLGAIGGLLFIAYLPFATPVFAPIPSTPLAISTPSPLKGSLNKPYQQIFIATGGMQPYTWSVTEDTMGVMSHGLQLTDKGVLSGTPTKAMEASFSMQVTDSAGSIASKKFSLDVVDPPPDVTHTKAATKKKGQPKAKKAPESQVQPNGGNIPPSPNKEKTPTTPPKLEDIFSFQMNLIGIFVAMVFGLTPGLLFDRLQQQADRYKADLKSSQSTGRSDKKQNS
jgi:hypothetical protein